MQKTVSTLVNTGWVIAGQPIHGISTEAIVEASEVVKELVLLLQDVERDCSFTRKGENETDVMFIHRNGSSGKDIKYFLHITHDIMDFVRSDMFVMQALKPRLKQLQILHEFHTELNQFVLKLLQCIYDEYRDLFTIDIVRLYRDSISCSQPYSTTTLRGLWYPPQVGQSGAKAHFDRSLLTTHMGDSGGVLQAHQTLSDEVTFPISPELGSVTLFWGVKALLASQGKLMPLRHSATATPNQDRFALVQFNHIDCGQPIVSAGEAFKSFWMARQVENLADVYHGYFR